MMTLEKYLKLVEENEITTKSKAVFTLVRVMLFSIALALLGILACAKFSVASIFDIAIAVIAIILFTTLADISVESIKKYKAISVISWCFIPLAVACIFFIK